MAASDLTTLDAVREHQQKLDDTNTAQDDLIESLITVASSMITRYTQREFAPTVGTDGTPVARLYRYDGRGILSLAPDDARSVTQVRVDTDTDSPTTLEDTQYRLHPIRCADGVYTHLHLDVAGAAPNAYGGPAYREVEVTGTWGFASVPLQVERACILLVMDMLSRTSSWRNSDMDELMPRPGGATIPGHIRGLLASYRRHTIGA